MRHLLFCFSLGLIGLAMAGCGDDSGPGGGGGGSSASTSTASTSTAGSTNSSSSSSGSGSSTSTSTSASATGSSSSSGGMGFGCTEDPQGCSQGAMECACAGECTLCNEMECFTWDFAVQCVDGIAGVTCICTVDGQMAGNCDENQLSCGLETSCCVQFLQP